MRGTTTALMTLLLASGFAASVVADETEVVEQPAEETGRLTLRWDTQVILDVNRDHVRYLTNDESVLIAQSSSGLVTALNAEDGRRYWARQVGFNDEASFRAATSLQHVLITTGPEVHSLDKFTGTELFSYRLPRQPSVGPAVDEGSFFVPFMDGSIGGFSFSTLEHLEKFGTLPAGIAKSMAWRFVSNEEIHLRPVVGTGTVAFATELGNIHGLHASGTNGGHSLYQLLVKHRIVAPLSVARTPEDEFLIFATDEDIVTCVKMFNGRMMWTYPMGRAVDDDIVIVGDNVYVVTQGEGLSSLSLSRGRLSPTPTGPWFVPDVDSVAAVSATRVYAVDNTMHLLVVDRETAEIRDRIYLGEETNVLGNPLTDRVYLYSNSGRVRCFAEEGSSFATYHQRPDRQPVMPGVPDVDPVEEVDESGF